MTMTPSLFGAMSAYEHMRWNELQKYWEEREERRKALVPQRVRDFGHSASAKASKAMQTVGEVMPEPVKKAGDAIAERALAPTIESVVRLLELLNDWMVELNSPQPVLKFHQKQGHAISSLDDLKSLDLEDVENYLKLWELRWRTVGAAEGGAAGALAMIPIPVAGSVAAISVDIVAMQALTTAVATRLCHAYGYAATTEEGRRLVNRMVRGAYRDQAGKVSTVKTASQAFRDSAGRVRWSNKLREDHRILAAVEHLMKNAGGKDFIPVKQARMGLPVVSVLVGSGTNAFTLGNTAKQAKRYCATRFLADKYQLPLPTQVIRSQASSDEGEDAGEPGD